MTGTLATIASLLALSMFNVKLLIVLVGAIYNELLTIVTSLACPPTMSVTDVKTTSFCVGSLGSYIRCWVRSRYAPLSIYKGC